MTAKTTALQHARKLLLMTRISKAFSKPGMQYREYSSLESGKLSGLLIHCKVTNGIIPIVCQKYPLSLSIIIQSHGVLVP